MKKKFWLTFLISMVAFSTIFVKAGPIFMDMGPVASEEDNNNENENNDNEEQGEILFLLMGIDDEYGNGGVDTVKEKVENSDTRYVTTGLRSDTMMLCKFNFDTGKTTLISVPRDTRTDIRTRQNKEKINHAHSYGGPNLAVDAVSDLLDVDLEYYVTVDYRAVHELVDDIGGVDLYVPQRMKYSDPVAKPPLYIDLEEGQQVLDGDKALQFLRFRSYPEGDLGRVHAQQYFLKNFAKQLLSPKNIFNLPKMAKTYFDYVDTNIPMGVVMKGIGAASKVDVDNLEVLTIPGEGQMLGNVSYFIYEEDGTRQLVDENLENFKINN